MRTSTAFAVILALAACGCGVTAEGLLKNAEFSMRVEGNQRLPASWQIAEADQALYVNVNDDGHSGSHSLHYVAEDVVAAGAVTQECACAKNTEYVLTAAMKSDGNTRPMVQIMVPGTKLQVVRLTSDGKTIWTLYSVRFNSGGAEKLQVRIFGDQGMARSGKATVGVAGIDDVQVYAASDAPAEVKPREVFSPPGPNIALDKPYTISPKPNYGYCTDPDDETQLTDGEYTVGYFWVQKTTVGWSNKVPVVITIDLGRVEPIAGLSYSTAAGVAGVSWPAGIGILVSDDGEKWVHIGDLIRLTTRDGAPRPDAYSQHRFATGDLETRGRYVQLAIDSAPYCFVDEIEVYRGPEDLLAQEPQGKAVSDVKEFFMNTRVFSAILWRLRSDLRAAQEAIEASELGDAEKTALLAKADRLSEEVEALPEEIPEDFTVILPLSDLHARIYALNAPSLRAKGLPPLYVWPANRWDPLEPTDPPTAYATGYSGTPILNVDMMLNEFRAEAFNLTNSTDEAMTVTVNVTGLPGGANPDYVSVREVLFTDTKDRKPIAAALPKAEIADDGYKIAIPAGCNRQVWLSFNPRDVKPGKHSGEVVVRAGKGIDEVRVALTLTVYPFVMPDEMTIAVGGWDYTNGSGSYDARPSNIPVIIKALREHWVNTPWATRGVAPRDGKYNDEGKLTTELTFEQWDEWVGRWPDAKNYCVFLAVGGTFEDEKMGTPRFNTMVGEWMTAWVAHMRQQGIDPRQLAVLLVDEPHRDEQVRTIITWAKAISAVEPDVVIWEDPTYRDPREADAEMFGIMDVMCPNLPIFMGGTEAARQFYVDQQTAGKVLWFYSCSGPAKLLDPSDYFRGQFWWAIQYGAEGSCYWAFADEAGSGSSWNSYRLERNQYSPMFIDATSVTDGKQMEAIREGAQDYEYFVMLREAIQGLERKAFVTPVLGQAKDLLQTGPQRVISDINVGTLGWLKEKDRSVMDQVRIEVLRMLVKISEL